MPDGSGPAMMTGAGSRVPEEPDHLVADGPEDEPEDALGPSSEETLFEELGALIDDAGVYAAAEIAFQKTRAKLAGKNIGAALALVIVALILLHIAIIALAVGLVLALAPLVTIWGAIGIVVGLMLLGVAVLVFGAVRRGKLVAALFASGERGDET